MSKEKPVEIVGVRSFFRELDIPTLLRKIKVCYSNSSFFRRLYITTLTFWQLFDNLNGSLFRLVIPTACFSDSSLFQQLVIPTVRCSDNSSFRQLVIPTACYSDSSLFRQFVFPTVRYSDSSLFWQLVIPTARYSDSSLYRQLDIQTLIPCCFVQLSIINYQLSRTCFSDSSFFRDSLFRHLVVPTAHNS